MSRFKHITPFTSWVKLNEQHTDEDEVERLALEYNDKLESEINQSGLTTRLLMDWFHQMLELYDSTELKGLVFTKMKIIWVKYFSKIDNILKMSNRELTAADIASLRRYKQITQSEYKMQKDAEAELRRLGLI
jgi:hypothetical protein